MSDAIDDLTKLLRDANVKVTFDPERDFTRPCFSCGETDEPRKLWDMVFRGGERTITRPFCDDCGRQKKPMEIPEHECDRRTIIRLLGTIRRLSDENEHLRSAAKR